MKRWLCGLVAVCLSGCASVPKSVPEPTVRMATASGVPLETLQRGKSIYVAQCGRCHEWVAPNRVKTSDWHLLVPGMCWNAGLTQADEALVLKYILAAKTK